MKLYFSPSSPFARKVRIAAQELGLAPRIEAQAVSMTPVNPDEGVRTHNPLGKIPALLADDGTVLYDSRVICEYLDALAGGGRLFPPAGPRRWTALRRQALADGMMDAAVLVRYERALRPQQHQWQNWADGQLLKVRTALDALEREKLDGPFDIGVISIVCALGYLDFRFQDEDWRRSRPGLAAWQAAIGARPSVAQSVPSA
jgi:glutathione S-transferase